MSVYRRDDSRHWWINVQWKDCPRIQLSTLTDRKPEAKRMVATLRALRSAGRYDLLGLIAARRLVLQEVHAAFMRDSSSLGRMEATEPTPELGALVDEWLAWLGSPAGISPRTKRRFAVQTVRRYAVSWDQIFALLPLGRASGVSDLTSGAIASYRKARVEAGCDGPTVNRDLCAIQSLLRYCEDERAMRITRPRFTKEREHVGRERWLTASESAAVAAAAPTEWWPLFATLIYTGMRIGEAQALRWGDVALKERRIEIHPGFQRLKTTSSDRTVAIPEPLAAVLREHASVAPSAATEPVFPGVLGQYWRARWAWQRTCKRASIQPARLHDLRHTFGVHAARSGVPLVRLQRLMGHCKPEMTLRYMRHAPDGDFAADAALVAGSMDGQSLREQHERLVRGPRRA